MYNQATQMHIAEDTLLFFQTNEGLSKPPIQFTKFSSVWMKMDEDGITSHC